MKRKHLITLEPAISEAGTKQMDAAGVQLVLPTKLHASYSQDQRKWLWSVRDLIEMLAEQQKTNGTG